MQEHMDSTIDSELNGLIVPGLIVGKLANGRLVFSAAGKEAVSRLYTSGGATVAQIARANGINVNLVPKWARIISGRNKTKRKASVVEPKLIPIKVSQAAVEQTIQIELSRGTIRMTLACVQDLGLIIEQLTGVR